MKTVNLILRLGSVAPIAAAVLIAGRAAVASDQIPGPPQKKPIAIVGATIHPVQGRVIRGGTVVFDAGKIVAVGKDVAVPEGAQRVDGSGQHVYPGLVASYTSLGLIEIGAVRASIDAREIGTMNPNVKALVAVNPDSETIPVARANGVLVALSVPTGGSISGQSALIKLDGWTFEDMALKASAGLHVNWPRMVVGGGPGGGSGGGGASLRDRALQDLEDLFDEAEAYRKGVEAGSTRHDDRLASLGPVLDGALPLIVAADRLRQIESAVAFAKRRGLRLIIYGGYDAPLCAGLLKENNVPVIVSGTLRHPRLPHDAYDAAFTLPRRLHEAGVTFCLAGVKGGGPSGSYYNVRDLANHAAQAVAYGLPRNIGLKAITQYPAQIFGVDDRIGTIRKGMDATLILTDGDAMQMATNVKKAWIDGRVVDLSSRHTQLWKKYRQKYKQLKGEE
ncbi:MAG: amidohydrolase family protein [Planctomycetota bacterium]|jgi:imidazolonepropionase-like amidohydrolase